MRHVWQYAVGRRNKLPGSRAVMEPHPRRRTMQGRGHSSGLMRTTRVLGVPPMVPSLLLRPLRGVRS